MFYLNQIDKYKDCNVIISLNQQLISQGEELDRKLKSGERLGKLFGCIILLKDNIATQDLPVTAGAMAMKDTKANRNAFLVDLLLKEDALILGKANLSEWANYISNPSSNGFSVIGGQTKNAYGDYDPGGSSSGSAVGVALNMCSVSIGSETCGSLLYPASMNSVVTIKPTIGTISRDFLNHQDIQSRFKSIQEIIAFNDEDSINRIPYGQKQFINAMYRNLSKDEYEKTRLNNQKIAREIIDNTMEKHKLEGIISMVSDLAIIYSAAGYPAVNVPAGYEEDGKPYGITFVASYLEDVKLLRYAYSYEQLTKHRKTLV